jgi:hypothetical protein
MYYSITMVLLCLTLLCTAPFATADDAGKIVLKETANGSRSLRPFTIQDKWEVQWDSTEGVSITLYTDKGEAVDALASSKKAGSGSTFYPNGGSYFLKVIARGDWTITVSQLP